MHVPMLHFVPDTSRDSRGSTNPDSIQFRPLKKEGASGKKREFFKKEDHF